MQQQVAIDLPNLDDYRQAFAQQGIATPLPTVPFFATGLLAELPPPPPGKTGWPWTVETPPLPSGLPHPKISIVTPSYNQGQFIEETIRSVLLQNYPNLEFIIIDGGSNDETKEILEKYSPWLSFWRSEGDRGQGHAINLGFSLVSGDYLAWLNSDDFYTLQCFCLVVETFQHQDCDFIYGDALQLNEPDQQMSYWQAFWVLERYLRFGGIVATHAAFWKHQIHQPIWEELHCNIDGELWFRLLSGTSKYHINVPLGIARSHPETKTFRADKDYKHLWEADRIKIGQAHDLLPPSKVLRYEFSFVQKLYHFLKKPRKEQATNYF
jgi:glycosyltransferase involved in cell wall biosynthesis